MGMSWYFTDAEQEVVIDALSNYWGSLVDAMNYSKGVTKEVLDEMQKTADRVENILNILDPMFARR